MNVTLIDVSTVDGKLTKWTDANIYEWSSPEDFAHFRKTLTEYNLVIMGSGTFNGIKDNPKSGFKPEKERLRIVLTRTPEKYKQFAVNGQLEFSAESPQALLKRLEKAGYKKALLVSGGKVATSFFKEGLVDELLLTIEPKIFGTGEPLVQNENFDISLRLMSCTQLNDTGTLMLQYKVLS